MAVGKMLTVYFFGNYVRLCSGMSVQLALQYREQIVSKHAIGLGRLCLLREGWNDTLGIVRRSPEHDTFFCWRENNGRRKS